MKTASEVNAEAQAQRDAARKAKEERIAAYLADLPPLGQARDPNRAEGLRRAVKEGCFAFSDIACDLCKTELVHGSLRNDSNPPTRWHDCPGCGERHLLPA